MPPASGPLPEKSSAIGRYAHVPAIKVFPSDRRRVCTAYVHGNECHSKRRRQHAVQANRRTGIVVFVQLGQIVIRIDIVDQLVSGLIVLARQIEYVFRAPLSFGL